MEEICTSKSSKFRWNLIEPQQNRTIVSLDPTNLAIKSVRTVSRQNGSLSMLRSKAIPVSILKFLSDRVQIVFQENEVKLSRPLFIGSMLESYWMLWAFANCISHYFLQIFWGPSWNHFLVEVRQINKNFLNSKLFIGSILENGFEATLWSKLDVLNLLPFFGVCKFLSQKVENIISESEAKHSKFFKSIFGPKNCFIKWFWSFLELNKECSGPSKMRFFSFFSNFWVTKLGK